jgi:glycosyltransferase involved in cell wall biosynthesis
VISEQLTAARSAWNCLTAMASPDPLQARFGWSPRLADANRRLLEHEHFDVVHVEHLRGARYGLSLMAASPDGSRRPAMVWDAVDSISRLFDATVEKSLLGRARLVARLELPRTLRFERVAPAYFDAVLVTSEDDRRQFLKLSGSERQAHSPRIEVVPNALDLLEREPDATRRQDQTIVMTGKMSYHANATAALWLVREVMPLVWSSCPDARLLIVGKAPPREVRALAGSRVTVTGEVDDLRPFLEQATVSVAPIRYGVGIQNKVLEAFSCGTPVVATPMAITAIAARSGHDVLVADDADAFAGALVKTLADGTLRDRLSAAGRALAKRYGLDSVGRRLTDVYRETMAHP